MKLSKIFILLMGVGLPLMSHGADDSSMLGVVVRMSYVDMMATQGKTEDTPEEFSMPGQEKQHYPVRKLPSQPFLTGLLASLKNPSSTSYKFHKESWWVIGQQNLPALEDLDPSGTLYLYSVPNVEDKDNFKGGQILPFDVFWSQFAYHPGKYGKEEVVPSDTLCTIFALKFDKRNIYEGASSGSGSAEGSSGDNILSLSSEDDVAAVAPEGGSASADEGLSNQMQRENSGGYEEF